MQETSEKHQDTRARRELSASAELETVGSRQGDASCRVPTTCLYHRFLYHRFLLHVPRPACDFCEILVAIAALIDAFPRQEPWSRLTN